MTGDEALRETYREAMRLLELRAADWLDAKAAGKATIAHERRLTEAERATRRIERQARRKGIEL